MKTTRNFKTIKSIIAMVLIACIMLTGNAVTANAANTAANYEQLKDGCTVTMKVGETKRFLMTDENGNDLIPNMAWKTSNKEIVKIDTDFVDDTCDFREYIEFTANAEGTVTIKGRTRADYEIDKYNGFERESCPDDINITVKVTKATVKMTSAQKKCKHSWKTTKKATCQRVGTKVCKKCKLKKTLKKTGHKWETITREVYAVKDILYEAWYVDPEMKPDLTIRLSDYIPTEQLARAHIVETLPDPLTAEYDIVGLPEGTEAAKDKFFEDCHTYHPYFGFRDVYDYDKTITETVTRCKYCGKHK